MVQQGCYRYYWECGNPDSGMAVEVLPGDENLVAVGASGFGIMGQLVATERKFIARDESIERMLKIVRFLKKADRFHEVWPHFLDGRTVLVNPYFGKYDDGGDLVETAFLTQGLLAAGSISTATTTANARLEKRSCRCGARSSGIGIASRRRVISCTGTGRPTMTGISVIRLSVGTKQ